MSQLRPAAGAESRKRDTFFYERKIYFPNLIRVMEAGMYNKVDANLNFVDREKQVEKFWEENDIFRKSMENRKEGGRPIRFMTDRRRQTASRTSVTF